MKDADPQYRPTRFRRPLGAFAPTRRKRLGSAAEVWCAERDRLLGEQREFFIVYDLTTRLGVIERRVCAIGTLNGIEVHPREVFRPAILNAAASIIVVHNHPSGECVPSAADIVLTARLREVGDLIGITLADHVIVAADGYASLAERGWV